MNKIIKYLSLALCLFIMMTAFCSCGASDADKKLRDCVNEYNYYGIYEAFQDGADPDISASSLFDPYYTAARRAYDFCPAAFKLFVDAGMSFDKAVDDEYESIFVTAARNNDWRDRVKYLLDIGLDPNKQVDGMTAIEQILSFGYDSYFDGSLNARRSDKVIDMLLEQGGDYSENALKFAWNEGRTWSDSSGNGGYCFAAVRRAALLLDKKNITPDYVNPVLWAVLTDDDNAAALISGDKWDALKDKQKNAVFGYAAAFGSMDVIHALEKRDKDGFENYTTDNNGNALFVAARYNTPEALRYMIENTTHLYSKDYDDLNAAERAYYNGKFDNVKVLAKHGLKLTNISLTRMSADDLDGIMAMMNEGAKLDIDGFDFDDTELLSAVLNNDKYKAIRKRIDFDSVFAELVDIDDMASAKQVYPFVGDGDDESFGYALLGAIANQENDFAKQLIEEKIDDINKVYVDYAPKYYIDEESKTCEYSALYIAVTRGNYEMCKYLLDHGATATKTVRVAADRDKCIAIYDLINK